MPPLLTPRPCALLPCTPKPCRPLPPLFQLEEITGVPEGTSGQICNQIAQNPAYLPQLDTAIVSGKKTLQR